MKCADDDECSALGEAACSGGRCVNTHGSFTCECGPGSVLDSTGEPMCRHALPIMQDAIIMRRL